MFPGQKVVRPKPDRPDHLLLPCNVLYLLIKYTSSVTDCTDWVYCKLIWWPLHDTACHIYIYIYICYYIIWQQHVTEATQPVLAYWWELASRWTPLDWGRTARCLFIVDNLRLEARFSTCELYHIDSLNYMPVPSKSQCSCKLHYEVGSPMYSRSLRLITFVGIE